jgi:hypothetical protein
VLNRTRREDIVFTRPFLLRGWAETQPAGTYAVETEEELIEGLSFPAYRRVSTTITRQATQAGALIQTIPVDPQDLAEAQAADGEGTPRRLGAGRGPDNSAGLSTQARISRGTRSGGP